MKGIEVYIGKFKNDSNFTYDIEKEKYEKNTKGLENYEYFIDCFYDDNHIVKSIIKSSKGEIKNNVFEKYPIKTEYGKELPWKYIVYNQKSAIEPSISPSLVKIGKRYNKLEDTLFYEFSEGLTIKYDALTQDMTKLIKNDSEKFISTYKNNGDYRRWIRIEDKVPSESSRDVLIKEAKKILLLSNGENDEIIYIYSELKKYGLPDNYHHIINHPIQLERNDLFNIYDIEYSVTDKADGYSVLCITKNCEMYIISQLDKIIKKVSIKINTYNVLLGEMMGDVKDTGSIKNAKSIKDTGSIKDAKSIKDTIEDSNINVLFYDILVHDDKNVSAFPLKKRLELLSKLDINMKTFIWKSNKIKSFYNKKREYPIDGLILTPNLSYKSSIIYKWKPKNKLSIDFLAKQKAKNKSLLYVGKQQQLFGEIDIGIDGIIECIWDGKWKMIKLREDKGKPNAKQTATSVWRAIQNPVELSDLYDGYESVRNKYGYWVSSVSTSENIRIKLFHNKVKSYLYNKYCKKGDNLIDIGGGHANDLHKWKKVGISNVLILENDSDAIIEGEKRLKENNDTFVNFIKTDVTKENVLSGRKGINPDVISCHFAIHYFINSEYFYDILTNLKKGGYFIFTTFNKDNIIPLFNGVVKRNFGQEIEIGKRDYVIVKPNKNNNQIGVYVKSIGSYNMENLVDINNFIKRTGFVIIEMKNFNEIDGFGNLKDYEKKFSQLNMFCVCQKK